jgi:predicted PurR-regulated permease PerM
VNRRRSLAAVRLRPTWGAIVLLGGAILTAVAAGNVFVQAHRILGWAVAATVAAVLLTPLVQLLARYMPKALAFLLTFATLAIAAVALGVAVFGDLRDQVDRIREEAPAAAARIEERDDRIGEFARDVDLSDRVTTFVADLDDRVGTGGEVLAGAALSFPPYFVSAILTVFLMIYGERIVAGGVRQIDDEHRRRRVGQVLSEGVGRGRSYVLLAVVESVVVGAAVWVGCQVLEVPAPMVLALIAAVIALVPYLGVVLAWAPVLLLGLGFTSVSRVALLTVVAVAMQVADLLWVRRRVENRTVHVGPVAPVVIGLLGFELYWIGGALYAAALAVFALAIADAAASDDEPVPTPVDEWVEEADEAGEAGRAGEADDVEEAEGAEDHTPAPPA